MTHFDRSLRSQFYLTGPRPCPYLPNRKERKLFTNLIGANATTLHDELAALGFRRSQNIAYRPACAGCSACVSTRVRAAAFRPSRSQRRTQNRNLDLRRVVSPAVATDEQFAVFERYLSARHADGGMSDMTSYDFEAMIEDTPVTSNLIEYRAPSEGSGDGDELVAACLTDVLSDGLSLVYSFFDPSHDRRSLGQFIILDHIAMAASLKLPYVYLGYWVRGSKKMDYKIKFQPSEILTERGWRDAPPT